MPAAGPAIAGLLMVLASAGTAAGQERLCDNSFEDCRAPILELIRNENVGIDVSYWMMTDHRYSNEIIKRWQAGVPVRIILDLRADQNYPAGAHTRQTFVDAGIPIRRKFTAGINHWKAIIYAGQNRVHFSPANFANGSYSPIEPYRQYVDEVVYFSDDPDIVQSFMTKYDDFWTDTSHFTNFANVTSLSRNYPTFPIHPDLNFPPAQHFENRLVGQIRQETQQIDAAIFRITSGRVPDALIERFQAGVPVRLITEPRQYRNTTYFWHSYNVDRMHAEGIPIKVKVNTTQQDMHQKSMVLYGRDMAVFGSSNWTTSSSSSQIEHNYFTRKGWMVQWFKDQFLRKWDNRMAEVDGGAPIDPPMFVPFEPGWPEQPEMLAPVDGASGQGSTVTLRWEGGWWAHRYDIYLGTSPNPPLVIENFMPGAATAGVQSTKETYTFAGLAPGTTYYWRIVGKTMADRARTGPVWSFTTAGAPPGGNDDLLADAYVRGGPHADANFGSAGELIVKESATAEWRRETYLKVDISAVDPGEPVALRLFGWLSDARQPAVTVAVHPVADTSWTESTITWNNRPPASGSAIAAFDVTGTTGDWYEVDLTTHAQAERGAGRSVMSLVLRGTSDTLPYAAFNSREAGNGPYLSVGSAPRTTADAYVRNGSHAGGNFGWTTELIVKYSVTPEWERESYVKFDISGVRPDDGVRLRLRGWLSDARDPNVQVAVHAVNDISWTENGITWNNRPPAQPTPLGSVTVAGTSPATYELDLTSHVQAARSAGQTELSLALKGTADTLPYAAFGSRESGQGPELLVTAGAGPGEPDPGEPDPGPVQPADAHVRNGAHANTNFGSATELVVKYSVDPQWERETYLKFDISDVDAGEAVALRLFGRLSDTRQAAVTVAIHPVSDTSWSESAITWNTKPPAGAAPLATLSVAGTASQWYQVDLTDYVQAQRSAGRTAISLALRGVADTLPYAGFSSRETGNGPELAVGVAPVERLEWAPEADAYVRNGPHADTNFGGSQELIVKFSATPEWERAAYLRFDISEVEPDDTVRLRMVGWLSDARQPSVTVLVHAASDTSWSESAITWNTRPLTASGSLGSLVVQGTAPQGYEVDLTSFIQAERSAGRDLVTLVLLGAADTLPYAGFRSRESATAPVLVATRP